MIQGSLLLPLDAPKAHTRTKLTLAVKKKNIFWLDDMTTKQAGIGCA